MSHLIHDVMGHVAVKCPIAGSVGDELDVRVCPTATRTVASGHWAESGILFAVGRRHSEMITVDMHRMMISRAQITQAKPDLISGLANQRRSRRENFAIDR